jgi:hypothetical protein
MKLYFYSNRINMGNPSEADFSEDVTDDTIDLSSLTQIASYMKGKVSMPMMEYTKSDDTIHILLGPIPVAIIPSIFDSNPPKVWLDSDTGAIRRS